MAGSLMAMSHSRPVNLDLKTIRFPIMAISSIIHRVTGVIMFLGAFVVMGLLHESLQGPAGFASALELMDNALVAFCLWGFVSVLGYHFVAGIKHLMMDLGHFETLESAPGAARFTLASGVAVVVLSGIWVW